MLMFFLLAGSLAACGSDGLQAEPGGPSSPSPSASPTPAARGREAVEVRLELSRTTVPAGGRIPSVLVVENDTGRPVRDPGCVFSNYAFGLVPADDPDAELWGNVMTDCAGPSMMEVGFAERWAGPSFPATDAQGRPLEPGEYLAVVDIHDAADPEPQAVTITD